MTQDVSGLRQRNKPPSDKDLPPDLVVEESDSSSWEKSLDDNGNNTDGSSGDDDEGKRLVKQPSPKLASIPTPTSSKLDKFLATYGSFSGSTFTADQGIKILQWSSWAISYATQRTKYTNLSPSLRKLYNELSMTRYVLRFYGFFQSLEGYRSGSWAGGSWDNPRIAKIAKYLMAGSMLAYYPLEHLAYAGWQMPKLVKVNANKISAISCGFWTAYIVGDFWVSCLKWKELKMKLSDIGEVLTGKQKMDDYANNGDIVSFLCVQCIPLSFSFATFVFNNPIH